MLQNDPVWAADNVYTIHTPIDSIYIHLYTRGRNYTLCYITKILHIFGTSFVTD